MKKKLMWFHSFFCSYKCISMQLLFIYFLDLPILSFHVRWAALWWLTKVKTTRQFSILPLWNIIIKANTEIGDSSIKPNFKKPALLTPSSHSIDDTPLKMKPGGHLWGGTLQKKGSHWEVWFCWLMECKEESQVR